MIIELDKTHRIHGTVHCWQLEKIRIVKGEKDWYPYKYYTTFGKALSAAAQSELRTSDCEGVVEALEAVEQLT